MIIIDKVVRVSDKKILGVEISLPNNTYFISCDHDNWEDEIIPGNFPTSTEEQMNLPLIAIDDETFESSKGID